MKTIPLTQGQIAIVDNVDYEVLSEVKWCAYRTPRTFYAVRAGTTIPKALERMHRMVLARKLGRPIDPGMQCDHEDGDGLNNMRANLFEVTHRGNGENRHIAKTSKYLGVSRNKCGRWLAQIKNVKKRCLGLHDTELAAAIAREQYIFERPELGARSNLPKILGYKIKDMP